jgi:hypothetical protein
MYTYTEHSVYLIITKRPVNNLYHFISLKCFYILGYSGMNNKLITCWTIGVLGFDSQRGLGIFLFTTASRTALGPTQPPIQWIPGALSLGVKWSMREADHSLPSSADVKECVELYLH